MPNQHGLPCNIHRSHSCRYKQGLNRSSGITSNSKPPIQYIFNKTKTTDPNFHFFIFFCYKKRAKPNKEKKTRKLNKYSEACKRRKCHKKGDFGAL
jgi:hypothetical protein